MKTFSIKCKAGALVATLQLMTTACVIEEGNEDDGMETESGEYDGSSDSDGDVSDATSGGEGTGGGDGDGDGSTTGDDAGTGTEDGETEGSEGETCESACPDHLIEQLDCGPGMHCVERPFAPVCEDCP